MEIPSSYSTATLDEVLSDLSVRFIINLPQEELVSRERVCFQIEEAHWYYEDFVREQRPEFPALSLPVFLGKIFAHNPMLSKWGMHQDAYREFMEYKHRVPVRGGILINEKMDKVILVKGWKAGASWAFPRGKINKDEADHICAVREVLEETGFDSSELVDPSAFLVDSSEENVDRHLQLYLIKGVPDDYNFRPLARKEISEVAWFSITELQAQSSAQRRRREQARINTKSGAEDSERGASNKLRVYKVYGFLPGLSRWIKDQKRIARQGRNKKHGGVYETEPESSAFEASPPRQPKARDDRNPPKQTTTPRVLAQATPHQSGTPQAAALNVNEQSDDALSMASAKLREMIGIAGTPTVEQPSNSQQDKAIAGQSLLAQLQGSNAAAAPKEPVDGHAATGVSISVSALFNASKQEAQQNSHAPSQPNFVPRQHPTTSPNFNPSVRKQANGRNGRHNGHQQSSKQPVTILQRGQPIPDRMQKTVSSPVTTQAPSLPPVSIPQPQPFKPEVSSPSTGPKTQIPLPPQAPPTSENVVGHPPHQQPQTDSSSNNKMARRPVLTIDAFTPPQPAQPPSLEHKGNLLDILRGARPPPPALPAMQLQAEEGDGSKPATKSIGDILAEQGVKLPQSSASGTMASPITDNAQSNNGATRSPIDQVIGYYTNKRGQGGGSIKIPIADPPQKSVDPNHLASLMKSLSGVTPKKTTPPATVKEVKPPSPISRKPAAPDQMAMLMQSLGTYNPKKPTPPGTSKNTNVSSPVERTENQFSQLPKPVQSVVSPISPSQNGFIGSPTTATNPAGPRTDAATDSVGRMSSFDRRSTIRPEQAQTLLGLFKSPAIENPSIQAASPTIHAPSQFPPKNPPAVQKTEKLVAPEMHRTGSLSTEQTAFLMNFLDTLATQHGV